MLQLLAAAAVVVVQVARVLVGIGVAALLVV